MSIKEKTKNLFIQLKELGKVNNIMSSPKIEKVVISVGAGRIKDDKRKKEIVEDRLGKITGQKVSAVPSKKSVAGFKMRQGEVVGYKTTLRGERMYDFIDKYVNIAIPRTKDFRGISMKSVDDMGNLTIGIKEHIIFPETGDEEINDIFGLAITIVSSAKNKADAEEFFKGIGIPFKKEEKK